MDNSAQIRCKTSIHLILAKIIILYPLHPIESIQLFILGCPKIFLLLRKSNHILVSPSNITPPSNYMHVIIQIKILNL